MSARPRSQVHSSMPRTKEKNNLSNLYKPHEQSYWMWSETQMNEWLAPSTLQCPSAVSQTLKLLQNFLWLLKFWTFHCQHRWVFYGLNLASQSGSPLMQVNIVSDVLFSSFWPVNNHKKHNGAVLDPELLTALYSLFQQTVKSKWNKLQGPFPSGGEASSEL